MVRLKRGNAPKAVRRRRPSAAVLETEVDQLRRELNEALAQQTATADVLKIISRSTLDLQAVLTTLVETASLHCDAYDSLIFLHQSGKLHVKAHYGPLPLDFAEWSIGRGWITGRAFIDRTTIHVHDPAAFAKEFPDGAGMALLLGYRSILAVPLLRENEAIGVITIRRSEAKPFAKTQIELVEAFAHQAVIAIENARLFEAEQRRTAELTEALEQKTATSEVLRVISSSPGDLKPVFDAMLGNAAHLCEAQFGILSLYEGGAIRVAAMHNMPPVFAESEATFVTARRAQVYGNERPGATRAQRSNRAYRRYRRRSVIAACALIRHVRYRRLPASVPEHERASERRLVIC